ncbi:MAG: DivIVA domain-containing protein [Microbacteriaceae bacterium]
MAESFPRAQKSERGYRVDQVEKFLAEARAAFAQLNSGVSEYTAATIRTTAFTLDKGGYQINAVDEALERLEAVFYQKEREQKIAVLGAPGWSELVNEQIKEVVARLKREPGKKFKRSGPLRQGYSRSGVDAFADLLLGHFENTGHLSADQVRKIAFIQQSNGYQEAQVDAVLDRVVELLLNEEFGS